MPELPDILAYQRALEPRIVGAALQRVRLGNPFVLRSVAPTLGEVEGKQVLGIRRLGKRIVLGLEDDLFLIFHLMIAGRLHWRPAGAKLGSKTSLAALDFEQGCLVLTEAGSKRRSSLHVVRGEDALWEHHRGGIEPLDADLDSFAGALTSESHTLKRALTDPRLFSGIGNAYSDEILHRARLSPVRLTRRLTPAETVRLFEATHEVLTEWTDRLCAEAESGFPEKVTAFRDGMAVHGRCGQPCPECGSPVQRIVYAENECNYCPTCQNDGRLLADRALSRLLRRDWPRTVEEMEEHLAHRRKP